jgi:LPXTG-motif cell wall-anchored protein
MVEIVETPDYVSFVGPAEGDIEGQEDRFVGEVSYDGISELDYTFELVNGSSGSLQLAFESYFSGEGSLASTGVEAGPSWVAGIAALGLGALAIAARRVRRNRA